MVQGDRMDKGRFFVSFSIDVLNIVLIVVYEMV